jgi:DNA repair protein RadC
VSHYSDFLCFSKTSCPLPFCEQYDDDVETAKFWLYCNARTSIGIAVSRAGSSNGVQIPIRALIQLAIDVNARSIIITHNHPSGHPYPSKADITQTRIAARALQSIDVRLDDHIIFASDRRFSFRHSGLI